MARARAFIAIFLNILLRAASLDIQCESENEQWRDYDYAATESYIIPDGYHRFIPPVKTGNYSMTVKHHMQIDSISELQASTMDFSLGYWHTIIWKDDRLQFPDGHDSPLSLDTAYSDKIWIPDVIPQIAKAIKSLKMFSKQGFLLLHKDKTVKYSLRFDILISCPMNLATYPMDSQSCQLFFEGRMTNKSLKQRWEQPAVSIKYKDIELELPEFSYSIKTAEKITKYDDKVGGHVEMVMFQINFQRHLGGHIMQTFLPTIFLVCICCSVYSLPPSFSAHRLIVTVTATLTLSTQLAAVRSSLPPMTKIRAIDIWTAAAMTTVFSVLLSVCIITSFRWHHLTAGATHTLPAEKDKMQNVADILEKIFRIMIPLSYLVFNLCFWLYYLLPLEE